MIILAASPNSGDQIYIDKMRSWSLEKSDVLDGSLDEDVLIYSQCRRPHERHGCNPRLCPLCSPPLRSRGSL